MTAPIILKGSSRLLMPVISQFMAITQLIAEKDVGTIYGTPSIVFQTERDFKPQVQLHFAREGPIPPNQIGNPAYVPGAHSHASVISFRIMNLESNTITLQSAQQIARLAKTRFMTGRPYVWQKGKVMCAYTDHKKGYGLKLHCLDKTVGRRLVENVLDLQNHSPDWEKFTTNTNEQPLSAYPERADSTVIMGRSVKIPRKRPTVDVTFRYAVLHIHGLSDPLILCDRTGKFSNPLA